MNQHQRHKLYVTSSVLVGFMAFFVVFFTVLLIGAILLGPLPTDELMPLEIVILFLISALVGLVVAVFVGIKYYRRTEKAQ